MIRISSQFDSGAIEVLECADVSNIRLNLPSDNAAAFRQWFHFRLQGARGQACSISFENAGQSAYPGGWDGYRVVASYDRRNWFRLSAGQYDGERYTFRITPDFDSVYFAYFEPYSWERHLELLGEADASPVATVTDLGATPDGRDLNLITVGRPAPGRRNVWITARQHPGETMAEFYVEGLLRRLYDTSDPVSRRLLERACFHVVPNMNPDGSLRGNLRTNARGTNLNRAWREPDMQSSPEVALVRARMEATGVDVFLDIHGDETLPYVFIDGNGMVPGFTDAHREQERRFTDALLAASPDFQMTEGYAPDRFTDELLTLASKWVYHRFGCLALTLEMPFKDNANLPDGLFGWSSARSQRLGAATLQALLAALDERSGN
ncbi:Putative peptidase M14, carboxypeptidase A [Methyloversatilis universalis FAM5]|uniref:Peptidase M14, carboxypeptidase A n=1 Tax=Methyloversatilis universalis (strain ATCC BAA-1314 / DSM 25237 / JCM 13912 / CCUG 52030 / FAM5) TaxID=1000565 RepID=F5RAQ3_METUF|nr:M14-type cytosolic carboxypeptidase [Methyloversatilis universalis]EGK72375.1 Putative peptidase M14, carboxypeptidase A [Methyloversatilis universalis FAM5]